LVNAVKGLDDVRTRNKTQEQTSFAVSITVDQSGSMSRQVANKSLYDAAMVLSHTLEQLEMAYEVRGFGSSNAQYKAMNDPRFIPQRAAHLASDTLGTTYMADSAGLSTLSLLAREETNRLYVSLTDGDLDDHDETVSIMQDARRKGVVTFGIFLGHNPSVDKLDEIYGRGNWTTIQSLGDMPKTVGQRIASIFKAMR
jgi:nitric oxide reductase activation protein